LYGWPSDLHVPSNCQYVRLALLDHALVRLDRPEALDDLESAAAACAMYMFMRT
jgi:hypothetical protein